MLHNLNRDQTLSKILFLFPLLLYVYRSSAKFPKKTPSLQVTGMKEVFEKDHRVIERSNSPSEQKSKRNVTFTRGMNTYVE